MKITAIETYWTRIPFDMGGKPATAGGLNWQTMNTVWLRIVTDQGLEGWGEAFGHASAATTMAVLNTQLVPAALGQDARDIAGLRARLSKAFHGFGRNGAHVFALSALDIALWDIAGKAAGLPVFRLLGGKCREKVRVYQGVGGADPSQLAEDARAAVEKHGYTAVKIRIYGFHQVKVKVGSQGQDDSRRLRALRMILGRRMEKGRTAASESTEEAAMPNQPDGLPRR